jgi:hypothetical protein
VSNGHAAGQSGRPVVPAFPVNGAALLSLNRVKGKGRVVALRSATRLHGGKMCVHDRAATILSDAIVSYSLFILVVISNLAYSGPAI